MGRLRLPAALFAALLLTASPASANDPTGAFAGATLAQALERLRGQGLDLIYSSELVRDDMLVTREPDGATPREILDSLLEPHGLLAADGPDGALLVVAAAALRPGAIRGTVRAYLFENFF